MPDIAQAQARRPAPAQVPPMHPFAAPIGNADADVRFILRNLDVMDGGDTTVAEVRRAYGMIAAHNTTPAQIRATILMLDRPAQELPPMNLYVDGSTRRVALAAMLGIAVGFEGATAQRMIDRAREKKAGDVVTFLAGEIAVLGMAGSGVYGCYLAAGKGLTTAGAKVTAIKAGGLTVGGAVKAGAYAVGGVALAAGAGLASLALASWGYRNSEKVADDHMDLIEPKFDKDQRILVGLQQGQLVLPNPAPRARR